MKVPSLALILMGPEEELSIFFLRSDKALSLEMTDILQHLIGMEP